MSEAVDYEQVLADLRAKRDQLDAAIAGIEAMLGLRAIAGDAQAKKQVAPEGDVNASQLGPGAFLGMTIVDATKKYLAHKRANQRTEEILKALRDGGLVFSSANPLNTVGSVLNREFGNGGDIVRVARGVWGLATWHPRMRRKPEQNGGTKMTPEDEADEAAAVERDAAEDTN